MLHKRLIVVYLLFVCLGRESILLAQSGQDHTLTIHLLKQPLNSFVPDTTLGACYDGHQRGENEVILQAENVKAMQSVDLKPLSYRLRTELGIEAWHWNPKGKWSGRNEGYWTSSPDANDSISVSYGYRLPRRGNTFDEANNDGYSRIDDGDESTFWKSNPYLDTAFTGESNKSHPQWVVIDLGKEKMVDAISIHWGNPFATEFTLDYGLPPVYPYMKTSGYYEIDSPRLWKSFPNHEFRTSTGGNVVLRLANKPVMARMIRVGMSKSNAFRSSGEIDIRDSVGFAIAEVFIGVIGKNGKLKMDYVHHSINNHKQSKVTVSSNDPWHRAIDIDSTTEQVGIDGLFRSGLNNKVPMLISTGVLYDIPENSLALVDYLSKKQYPFAGIELGEEPDGQDVSPEDYGALYHRWIKTISTKYPQVSLGGPSLQTLILNQYDEMMPTKAWTQRFLNYLQARGSLSSFKFFSFEWYPFDEACDASAPQLQLHPSLLQKGMHDLQEIQQMKNVPLYITEYGYSAFDGINDVQIQSALMNADIVGQFLTQGGKKAFLYGLEPKKPDIESDCAAGSNMILGTDDNGIASFRTATYYGAAMIKKYWAKPSNQMLNVYPVSSTIKNEKGEELVSAYALISPDSSWSVMAINKDPKRTFKINIAVEKEHVDRSLRFPLAVYQYSGKQYQWVVKGEDSHPSRSLPPEENMMEKGLIELPPYSLTVVRENK
jgi:hypothetical protein